MPPLVCLRSTSVVTPQGTRPACVHIAGERIVAVRNWADLVGGARLHDAGDRVVMPGVVDTHVHVNEPGRTEWEGFATATSAAAAGGVTTIVDMPLNAIPPTTTAVGLDAKRGAARGRVHVDVGFWGGVVPGNAGELDALCDAGVLGFKCFLAPSGVDEFPAVTEADLREALPIVARRGVPLLAHAESAAVLAAHEPRGDPRRYETWLASRPADAEVDAIALLTRLGEEFGARIHVVHLSDGQAAIPQLREASARLALTVETCPHYLTFASEDISEGATAFKCAPPIRERANRERLWRGLIDGDVDMIASDHSPCPPHMKCAATGDFVRAWGGISSLEVALAAVWTAARSHGLTLGHVCRWMSAAPARLAGLDARKGAIAAGMDADLVVFDPDETWAVDPARLLQRHKLTPYAGMRLTGRVHETWVRGRVVFREGEVISPDAPSGALIARSA